MAPWTRREESRSVSTMSMVQCVMISGMTWMLEWSAGNWDTVEQVLELQPKSGQCQPSLMTGEILKLSLN